MAVDVNVEVKMDATETVKDLKGPIKRLADGVCNIFGKPFEAFFHRRETDAKVYRVNQFATVLKEHSDLPIICKGDSIEIDNTSDFEALCARTGQRLAYQEITKQQNIETIIGKAIAELEGKEVSASQAFQLSQPSDEKISPEWMNRFINAAGDISTKEMQELWAKVLTGEAVKPNSYSLRTLECLRNLSSSDAQLFEKISEFIISDSFLFNDNELNTRYGITYRDILDLGDCGLINPSGFNSRNMFVSKQPQILVDFGEYILVASVVSSEKEHTISFADYLLTRAGKELSRVARKKSVSLDYAKDVSSAIKRNNKDNEISLTLHNVIQRNADGTISYDLHDIIAVSP